MAVPSGVVPGAIPGVVSGPLAVRAQVNRRNGQLAAWTDNHSNLDDRATPTFSRTFPHGTLKREGGTAGQGTDWEEPLIFNSAVGNST